MKVKILSKPKGEYGQSVPGMGGLQIEQNQFKMLSPQTGVLGGYTHDETRPDGSSGTDVKYGNSQVEGQKGEPFSIGNDGSANLWGRMYVPGTNIKFDSAAKTIAKDEDKVAKSMSYANNLVQNADPTNKYQRLTFGSGMVMLDGNAQKSQELNSQKEALASIQNTMHTMADHMGVEPQKISETMKAEYGVNIGKGKYFAKYGFSDIDKSIKMLPETLGIAADGAILKMQKDMMSTHGDWVNEALQKYGSPRAGRFDDGLDGPRTQYVKNYVASKLATQAPRSGDVNLRPRQQDVITPLEMSSPKPFTTNAPMSPLQQDGPKMMPTSIEQNNPQAIPNNQMPSVDYIDSGDRGAQFKPMKNKLGIWDILPEAMTALEQPQPVPGHTINSYLQTPYNVSFQDRRNDNMSTFNTAAKSQVNNPAAIGALAGQEYVANNAVNADEFRTNQGLFNTVTNENYNTLNADKKLQLNLDMDQEQKQAQALAYTRRDKFNAISSIAEKKGAIDRANFTDSMIQNMYHSQGVDANGKPLHQNTAVINDPYVALQSNDEDEKRKTEILKRYGFDNKGRKVSEVTDKSYTGKFGKKITKLPTNAYGKL